jgi:hypothetical protein
MELQAAAVPDAAVHPCPPTVEFDFAHFVLEYVEAIEKIADSQHRGIGEGDCQLVSTDCGGVTEVSMDGDGDPHRR